MNEIYEAAIKYAEKGWAVFPVRKNKTPYTANGFHDATTDLSIISKWWEKWPNANVAIATGSMSDGLTVIDIDIDANKGIYGNESFKDWCDQEGLLIDSLNVVTGRGGKHLYFKSTYPYKSKIGVLEGVDIKGEGGYVIAPPSVHQNGNEYYFDGDEDEEDIVCVQEDSDVEYFLNEMCDTSASDKPPLQIPESVNEGGRNDMIFKMASSLQSKGVDDDVILSICQGYNEKNCHPPLDDNEVSFIVNNVVQRYEKGAQKPNTKEKAEPDNEEPSFVLLRANDILDMHLDPLNVYVGVGEDVPFLVEGTCILASKPKVGKSWFCNNLCRAITQGKDFLGYKTKKSHALYFDLETGIHVKQQRLQKMSNQARYDDGFWVVHVKEEGSLSLGGKFEKAVDSIMEQDPDIGVIIVDVFQKIRKAKKANENDYDSTYRELGILNAIAKKYRVAMILACHARKNSDDADPFSDILGTTALQGATDQMIVMYKTRFDDPMTHIAVKGRTIDGLIKLDAMISDGAWVKSDGAVVDKLMKAKLEEAYINNPFRGYMRSLIKEIGSWSGRCNEFVRKCKSYGIIDADDDISLKELGAFFSNKSNRNLAERIDSIDIKSNKNGSGSKTYSLTVCTVDTVDEWADTVGDVPFDIA